jgi:hypothetical protein
MPTARPLLLRRLLTAVILAAVGGFWGYFHLARPGTMHRALAADPEMAYFVDALSVFQGRGYAFVDHPGTPLSVVGSLLAALAHPLRLASPAALVEANLRDPAPFMTLAHGLLLAGACATIVLLAGLAALERPSDALLAVAIPASFYAAFPASFTTLVCWSHNSLGFAGGALLLGGLFLALRAPGPSPRALTALGLGAGVLAAAQIYFAVWTIGLGVGVALAALPRGARPATRAAARVALAAAAAFVLVTLPVAPRYPQFLRFLLHMVLPHGEGTAVLGAATMWLRNVSSLPPLAPVIFVAVPLLMGAVAAAARTRAAREQHFRLLAATAGAAVCWLLLLAAMGRRPVEAYFPALAAPLPLLLAAVYALWSRRGRLAHAACLGLAVLAVAGCAWNGVRAVRAHRARVAFRQSLEETVREYRHTHASGSDSVGFVLWGPGMDQSHCYALFVGAYNAPPALTQDVARVCPGEGIAWPLSTVLPTGARGRGVFIAIEAAAWWPYARAIGPADAIRSVGPRGAHVAFHRVEASGGTLKRWR